MENGDKYELLKLLFSGFGAATGLLMAGGKVIAALVAREASRIEKRVLEKVARDFMGREVLAAEIENAERRISRLEKRIDELMSRQ